MLLNEDLFEIDATIAPETSEETPATPEDNGIANQIITEINGLYLSFFIIISDNSFL